MAWVDEERSARTINFNWLGASPRTRWFALKSANKLAFGHGAPPHFTRRGTHNKAPRADPSKQITPRNSSTSNSSFPSYPPRVTHGSPTPSLRSLQRPARRHACPTSSSPYAPPGDISLSVQRVCLQPGPEGDRVPNKSPNASLGCVEELDVGHA
jgi:hypothetical protein